MLAWFSEVTSLTEEAIVFVRQVAFSLLLVNSLSSKILAVGKRLCLSIEGMLATF